MPDTSKRWKTTPPLERVGRDNMQSKNVGPMHRGYNDTPGVDDSLDTMQDETNQR